MKDPKNTRLLLHACPRCHGDLFPDTFEEDFACLQCGRRFETAQLLPERAAVSAERELVPAA